MSIRKCGSCGMAALYVSWSQLRHHEQCRQKAHLLRQNKKDPATNIRVYFPGTVVDRAMRAWLSDDDRKPGQMAASIQEVMDREEQSAKDTGDGIVKWKNRADRDEVRYFCIDLVKKLEPILYELVVPHQFEPSKRFKAPLTVPNHLNEPTEIFLVGEMDILSYIEAPNPWWVYDLKATKNDSYWRSTIGQLVFYDIACYLMFSSYTERVGLIQPMCKQPVVTIQVTNQQRVEMMQRILSMCRQIWNEDFKLAEDTRPCFMCAVKPSCSRFKPVGGKMQLIGAGPLEAIPVQPDADAVFNELLEL